MKKVFALSLLFISGCSSMIGYNFSVGSKESVASKITYEYDQFKRSGWLQTEIYMGSGMAKPGTNYMYRANYTANEDLSFIQVYAKTFNDSWCFIDEIRDSNGKAYTFHQISRDTVSSNNDVSIIETFAFEVSKTELERFAKNEVRFKAIGKRCDSIFEIDQRVSNAFLDAINTPQKTQ